MATPRTAFEKLLATTSESLADPVSLLLGSEPDNRGVCKYRLGNLDETVAGEFLRRLLSRITGLAASEQDHPYQLVEYDPGYRPEKGGHCLSFVHILDDQHLTEALRGFPRALTSVTQLTGQLAREEAPYSYILVSKLRSGEPIRFFRRVAPKFELDERKYLTQLVGAKFKAVRGAPFVFDFSFTCVQIGEWMFIFSPSGFEDLFNLDAALRARAASVLPTLGPYISPSTFDSFKDGALRSPFAIRRLHAIERVITKGATVAQFAQVIEEFELKSVGVEGTGAGMRLVYDGKRIREIVKLLSEDYLRGPVTNERYESSSKRVHST